MMTEIGVRRFTAGILRRHLARLVPAAASLIAAGLWLSPLPAAAGPHLGPIGPGDLNCLSLAVYHEARNQPIEGQLAVAHVVLNRLLAAPKPATICSVVYKGQDFSWTQYDAARLRPTDQTSWEVARWVAVTAIIDRDDDPVAGSTYFHSVAVKPYWTSSMIRVARIGDHVFYVPKPGTRPYVHLAD